MGKKEKIGWIGLGKMGNPMSKNLIQAGYSLSVYDIVNEKARELAERGAQVADSPKALAADADVIISMILDDPVLETVSIGSKGAFQGAKAGAIFISMSTVSPGASSRVAEEAKKKGIKYVQAPVVGSVSHAAAGTLTILASGSKDAYDKCADIFGALGQKTIYLGTGQQALYQKLLLNMMFGITSAMIAEALTFGERAGMDWNQMIDIISTSLVGSPVIGYKAQLLKDRNFAPAFTISQMAKDFDLALDAGKALNVAMPITGLVRQFLGVMKAKGKGEVDFFALVTLLEELSGIGS